MVKGVGGPSLGFRQRC